MKDLLRPDDIPLGISSIRHIGVIKKDDKKGEKRLVVLDAEGKMRSIPEKGDADNEQYIGEYQGGDGFWSYQTIGESGKNRKIKIWTNRARGNPPRTLKDGRFGDDFVVGLPAMGVNKSGELDFYMPTRAGIFKLDSNLQRLALDGIDGEDEKPGAIAMMSMKSSPEEAVLTYVRDNNIHFQEC